jgi:hypothetical protein
MGMALFVASNTLALFSSLCLARGLLPASGRLERALVVISGVPLVVLPLLTVLGMLGWLRPVPVTAAIAVLALAAHAWGRTRVPPVHEPVAVPAREPDSRLSVAVFGATCALVALQGVAFIAKQVFQGSQPHWDDISYHAPMAANWLQAGRLVLAPYSYHAYYPGTGELFATWFMLPTRFDAFASLTGLLWMALGAVVVAHLCRQLELTKNWAAVGVALFLGCRPFLDQASSFAAVDLAGSVLLAGAIALAVSIRAEDSLARTRACVLYMGCLVGLAVGTKVTFAPVGALTLVWVLLERRPKVREAAQLVGLFSLCALVWGAYWYLRNLWFTGNPLFPAKVFSFEGPLDDVALRPTALLFQLLRLQGPALRSALTELLNWPAPLASLWLTGYALAMLSLLRPGWWQRPVERRVALYVAAGLVALVTSVAGPFSGTTNAETVHLQIRLRFFLLVALLGIPLAMHWLSRARVLQVWLALAVTVLVASTGGYPPFEIFLVLGVGAAAGRAWPALPALRVTWARGWPLALCALLPLVLGYAMLHKQPENDRLQRKISPAWNALRRVPDGARFTWFATAESYKYYRGFGSGLVRVPVAVEANGARYRFLHEYWREPGRVWWTQLPRVQRKDRLVQNLQAQRIQYVFLIRQPGGPWPSQIHTLRKSKAVHTLQERQTSALLKLDKAEP